MASYNSIESIGSSLNGLNNVRVINLHGNNIADIDLLVFAKLPSLNYLNLGNSGIKSNQIDEIEITTPSNSSLAELILANNALSNSDDIKKLALMFNKLRYIYLNGNHYTESDISYDNLLKYFPNYGYLQFENLIAPNVIKSLLG